MMITMTEALDSLAQVAADQRFGFASLLTPQLARQVPQLSAEEFSFVQSGMDEPTNIFGEPVDFHDTNVSATNRIPMGLDRSHHMTERDIHDYHLPDGIGVNWKDLARALDYFQPIIDTIETEKGNLPRECCIELLVRWISREGRDATAGRLADALSRTGLRNLADNLIFPNDPSNINDFKEDICEMKNRLVSLEAKSSKLSARNKELENQKLRARLELEDGKEHELEISRMRARTKELKQELSNARQKCHETEQQNQKLRARLELDGREHEKEEDDSSKGTDQADTESRIDNKLKKINEQLRTVKLDLLIRLSERLQELYTETLSMVGETCKCSEDLRKDFYDLAYHGLGAEHYELVHRVKDLESAQEEMSEEEKKEYERLQGYQKDRQMQVEGLDKLWRRLFSPPDYHHKTPVSEPTRNKPSGGKKLTKTKSAVGSVIRNISQRRKESCENQGSYFPYTLM